MVKKIKFSQISEKNKSGWNQVGRDRGKPKKLAKNFL